MDSRTARWGYVSGWLSIVLNSFLAALKYWAGVTTGSVALVADAWHTISDTLSSIAVLFATRTSRKPADPEHPFGHGRADLIIGVAIGVLIGTVGLNFALDAIASLNSPRIVEYGRLGITAVLVSIVAKELLAQFAFFAARRSNMEAIRADGWHHRSDSVTSVLVLLGILFAGSEYWIDAVLSLLVALFLIGAAWKVIWESARPLLGESPNQRTIAGIRRIGDRISPVFESVHHIHVHRYGTHTEMTCHVNVDKNMSVGDAHDLVDDFEQALRDGMGIEPTVHIEPRNDAEEIRVPGTKP